MWLGVWLTSRGWCWARVCQQVVALCVWFVVAQRLPGITAFSTQPTLHDMLLAAKPLVDTRCGPGGALWCAPVSMAVAPVCLCSLQCLVHHSVGHSLVEAVFQLLQAERRLRVKLRTQSRREAVPTVRDSAWIEEALTQLLLPSLIVGGELALPVLHACRVRSHTHTRTHAHSIWRVHGVHTCLFLVVRVCACQMAQSLLWPVKRELSLLVLNVYHERLRPALEAMQPTHAVKALHVWSLAVSLVGAFLWQSAVRTVFLPPVLRALSDHRTSVRSSALCAWKELLDALLRTTSSEQARSTKLTAERPASDPAAGRRVSHEFVAVLAQPMMRGLHHAERSGAVRVAAFDTWAHMTSALGPDGVAEHFAALVTPVVRLVSRDLTAAPTSTPLCVRFAAWLHRALAMAEPRLLLPPTTVSQHASLLHEAALATLTTALSKRGGGDGGDEATGAAPEQNASSGRRSCWRLTTTSRLAAQDSALAALRVIHQAAWAGAPKQQRRGRAASGDGDAMMHTLCREALRHAGADNSGTSGAEAVVRTPCDLVAALARQRRHAALPFRVRDRLLEVVCCGIAAKAAALAARTATEETPPAPQGVCARNVGVVMPRSIVSALLLPEVAASGHSPRTAAPAGVWTPGGTAVVAASIVVLAACRLAYPPGASPAPLQARSDGGDAQEAGAEHTGGSAAFVRALAVLGPEGVAPACDTIEALTRAACEASSVSVPSSPPSSRAAAAALLAECRRAYLALTAWVLQGRSDWPRWSPERRTREILLPLLSLPARVATVVAESGLAPNIQGLSGVATWTTSWGVPLARTLKASTSLHAHTLAKR